MSAKKWLTQITFICTVVALIAVIIIGKELENIFYDIALAVFGSALLGYIMSLTEYFAERRKAMELFWIESRKVLKSLRDFKYLNCDAPTDLIINCFHEELEKETHEKFPELYSKSDIQKSTARDNLLNWLQENQDSPLLNNDDERNTYYLECLNSYKIIFQDCIESYCHVAEIDLSYLDNAYGNLDFLFGNAKFRLWVYESIFDEIRKYRNMILKEKYYFDLLAEGNDHFVVCAQKAVTINHFFFEEKETINNGLSSVAAYQTKFDDIEDALETFRCNIYRNAEKEISKRKPVFVRVKPVSE